MLKPAGKRNDVVPIQDADRWRLVDAIDTLNKVHHEALALSNLIELASLNLSEDVGFIKIMRTGENSLTLAAFIMEEKIDIMKEAADTILESCGIKPDRDDWKWKDPSAAGAGATS